MLGALGTAVTLALVNLSMLLGIGALSATPFGPAMLAMGVVAAFVAATVGGLVATALARVSAEISAPAASIGVIYAALAADLVARAGSSVDVGEIWASLSLAVVLMGALLLIAEIGRASCRERV